jgi:hypothetical protein
MNIGQLRKVLRTAEGQYRADDRGDIANALSAFAANLLQGDDSKTVASFVSRVEKARKPATSRTTGTSRRKR